jgi:hypothetical protein
MSGFASTTLPAGAIGIVGCRRRSLGENKNVLMKVSITPPFRLLILLAASLALAVSALGTVNLTPASGGGSISADTAANAATPAWTSLGSIVIAEPSNSKGDIGGGTLILKAPTGFEFNSTSTPSIAFTAGQNITAATIAVTNPTTLTITLTVSGSTLRDTLTIGGTTPVRVRPVAGTPLPSGNIYRPTSGGGTAVIVGVTATANASGSGGTSFGALREVAGAAKQLALQTAPPPAVAAGAVFSPQPVLLVQDQFGSTRNTANGAADNTTVVNAARGVGTGVLQGTTNVTAANGVVTFANLWHPRAETITVVFSSGSLTNVVSGSIIVNPAALTVRPNNLARTYGVTNPPLTVSYTGFIPGETLATSGVTGSPDVSTTAQTDSSAGTYPITASLGTLAAENYTFLFATGVLTVAKAPLTIAANDFTRLYGETNPLLTVTYTGFVLGQDSGVLSGSPSLTTTAVPSSPAGSYPIVVSAGSLTSPNYAFTFVNGTLTVVAPGTLFVDDFTRSADPGPLSPWVAQAGNWTVTGGILTSGTNTPSSYSRVYLTNVWTDFSSQARVKFSAGVVGGGLATRLNPASGARYAAWIYPEGSPAGSNVMRLLRFQDWTTFTLLQQTNLPGVGTNWHTLKLVVRGNQIAAHYDGNLLLSATDTNAQPLLNGGIDLEFWTETAADTLWVDDVLVALPVGAVASADAYSVRSANTLVVPAPGVLSNDTPEMESLLTANLAAGPAHGTLDLSTNGGFTYVPATNYTGTDTFTYRAQDDFSTSSVATVTITITPNHAPVATNNSYTLMANTTLTVPAPGILANDSDADGDALTAVLATAPTKGSLNLSPNGAFTYVPTANYVGSDSFTYRASDGQTNSALATVSISVTAFTPLFTDTFTRTNLSPWVVQAGNWSLSSGALKGGTNSLNSYGSAYLTNQWGDYSVESRVQYAAGGFGGGLAGRLNPATGARYAAWIYPEGSPGGPNMLKLLKFQDWNQFTLLQQVALPAVGTNWHTLKLVMQSNRLAVHYDGSLMLSVTDSAAQPLVSGGVEFEFWTADIPWTLTADDVSVSVVRNILATNDSYTVRMGGTLTIPSPGVLTNDFGELASLTAVLATNAAHGTLALDPSGGFTYVPVSSYSGSDTFAYRATDGVNTSSAATVAITITPNHTPVATNNSYTLMANTTLSVAAPGILANDSDSDGDALTVVLVAAPTKGSLNLNANGAFTYVPAADYVGSDSFTYRASDGQTNSALATVSISVTAFTPLFSDTFTRTNLSPWVVQAGNWSLSGGALKGGPNTINSYGNAYLTNQWGDYSVESRVQFAAGAFGGGLAGRLNPATGARYAAWIYPEGSPGGPNMLKLFKFQDWNQFTLLQQVALAGVGTNWHTLKLAMQSNRLAVHYDGTLLLSVTDSAAPPLVSGGVDFEFWTADLPWTLTADDVSVNVIRNVLATNDSYTVRMGGTLTVPAPGVLANDVGELVSLTAVLATNAAHGALALNSNGGFTYVPESGYSGSDAFAYRATDGQSTSSVAVVTITLTPNHGPAAANDSYTVMGNTTLTVSAPGILGNDSDPDGDALTAVVVSNPDHGVLILSTNGGFSYAPVIDYTGSDSFTYQANDGLTNSTLATVTLTVTPPGLLFADDFTRTNPPGALSPWVVRAGNWAINDGMLQCGPNSLFSDGWAYLTNNWTDCEVQARIQLPIGAFGGGLAGRLNPATGARYSAWIYPEGSFGGSRVWKLLKFQSWTTFTLMQQGSLPPVGADWHTLKLVFQGNRIDLYFDSTQLTNATDAQPYTSGGLGVDMWTHDTAYVLSVDDVQVNALPQDQPVTAVGVAPDMNNGTVTVTFQGAPGVLYLVQATTNLTLPNSWLTVSTNAAGGDGRWTFTDSLTALPGRFYRSAKP